MMMSSRLADAVHGEGAIEDEPEEEDGCSRHRRMRRRSIQWQRLHGI